MEADWDVDISPASPSMIVPWEGFVDLQDSSCTAVQTLAEAAGHPALREALIKLNSSGSAVFTSKCDIWQLTREEIESDEFAARPENARFGFASYIDILLCDLENLTSFGFHELLVRGTTENLRALELANCRVDLVVRPAIVHSVSGCGITVYTMGCGAGEAAAYASWQTVLQATVNATMSMAHLSSSARASSSIG